MNYLKKVPASKSQRAALEERLSKMEAQVDRLEAETAELEKLGEDKIRQLQEERERIERQKAAELAAKLHAEEVAARYANLVEQGKQRKSENRKKQIRTVMKKTGWPRAEAVANMDHARKNFGIAYKDYIACCLHEIPADQQQEKFPVIAAALKREKAENRAQKHAALVAEVAKATGWNPDYAESMIKRAQESNGVSYEQYVLYRFWELPDKVRKTYFSKSDADKLWKQLNKNTDVIRAVSNRDLFYNTYEADLGRPWMVTENMTLETFKEKFPGEKKIIYKPLDSSDDQGIEAFTMDPKTMKKTFRTISSLPAGVLEGDLVLHPEIRKLSSDSANIIYMVTIQTDEDLPGIEKNKVHFAYGGIRMGRGSSLVADPHNGGIIAVLDMNSGVVETDGVDFAGNVFECHPDTNVEIKGFQIPYFEEIKALIEKAGEGIPGYLAWEVAVTETGPVLVGVNAYPGAASLQTPYVPQKKGMRNLLAQYLGEPDTTNQCETPYGTKISRIYAAGIEFYWKKLEQVDGYEVYRGYEKEGPFEKIATIETRGVGTYTDSGFDHNRRSVFYTVRSFQKQEDGSLVFSDLVEAREAVYREEILLERTVTYMYSNSWRTMHAFVGWGEVQNPVWTSSDDQVATITADGVITAHAAGSCILTCTDPATGCFAETQVVVDRQAPEPLTEIVSRYQFNDKTGHWENNSAEQNNDAVIMMVGDMMCGKNQMYAQYTEEEGWNFNSSYTYVKDITASADFAMGNLETLLAAGWPYMYDETYIENTNNCNACSRYLDAVRYGGFDAVAMANNHNCDGGTRALLDTIEQVERYQLARTGVFRDANDRRFFIANVNGIKVGYVAYISEKTGFNGKNAEWSKEEQNTLLNIFNAEKAARDIAACREAGAEYVIAYMHWGFKNFRNLAAHQIEDAKAVANAGADYIVGANPHLIQVYDVVTTDDGREVPCAYSTGNFQAYMNQVTGNRDSVIIRIRLKRDEAGNVILAENNYIPCYTYTDCEGNRWAPVAVSTTLNVDVPKKGRGKIYDRIVATMGPKIRGIN